MFCNFLTLPWSFLSRSIIYSSAGARIHDVDLMTRSISQDLCLHTFVILCCLMIKEEYFCKHVLLSGIIIFYLNVDEFFGSKNAERKQMEITEIKNDEANENIR